MITRSQKIKLVVFLVASAFIGVSLLLLFTRHSLFRSNASYFVRVPGSVSGVQEGSVVAVRGVRVGSVAAIELFADDAESVRLKLQIDRKVPIRRDATATLSFQGVTGVKSVEISGGSPAAGTLPPEGYINYAESTFQRVTDQAEQLVTQASKLLESTNEIVRHVADVTARIDVTRIAAMLDSTQRALAQFEGAGNELRGLVRGTRAPLERTLQSADAAFGGARELSEGASVAVANVNETVSDLKRMLRQNEAQLRGITYNLRDAAQSFKLLGQELRQRPSRLLFSEAPAERQLP